MPGAGRILAVAADVTRQQDCQGLVEQAVDTFGGLHILVNNAGLGMKFVSDRFLAEPTRFWEVDPDTWRRIIETNVNGPFLMTRAAVPQRSSDVLQLLRAGENREDSCSTARPGARARGA